MSCHSHPLFALPPHESQSIQVKKCKRISSFVHSLYIVCLVHTTADVGASLPDNRDHTPFVSSRNNASCIFQLRLVAAFPGASIVLFIPVHNPF